MRELYFELYTRLVYNKFYFEQYRSSASRANFIICFIACITSVSGISGWIKLNQLSVVWAILIIIAPIFNAVSKYLPFNKRISAVNYFAPELDSLIDKVEEDWRSINYENSNITDHGINELIGEYSKQFTEMNHRYLKDDLFPDNQKLAQKAEVERDKFFSNKYGVDFNVQQNSAKTTRTCATPTKITRKSSI